VGVGLNKSVVDDVDSALKIAEEHGGIEARLETGNECEIHILFAPYVFDHPFAWNGWGFDITYWDKNRDRNPNFIFRKKIDPYIGK
jgi:hypothetical protein